MSINNNYLERVVIMKKKVVLAEKPSVGRDIARVLKCNNKRNGFIEGEKYIVTWALGHLVTLAEPEKYNEKYKQWKIEDLPMIPSNLKLEVIKKTGKQFYVGAYKALKNKSANMDVLVVLGTSAAYFYSIYLSIQTIGTKIPEIESAIRCIGAFEPCASSTILIICDRAVSFPTFVALIFKNPFLLMVAPMTLSPIVLSTVTLSPVIIDSSMAEVPSNTSPLIALWIAGLFISKIMISSLFSIVYAISIPLCIY